MNNNNIGLKHHHEFNTDKCRDEEGDDIEVELLPLHDDEDAFDDDDDVSPLGNQTDVSEYDLEGIEQLYWDDQGAALLMVTGKGDGEEEGEDGNRRSDGDGVVRTLSDYAQILASAATATTTTTRNRCKGKDLPFR
ncbi:Hypothetical protein, putative [Bodo saltans]|uniref:Uncharacterized protein n=1 Tax=Bodo saltans TaxID=75058 RepID=A0A0S4J9R0_BODSA|nr:Hypothetical protein, putative [Bodo saltans]|eukprot:CUG85114.1 Hypothetical protein, putative [Bodo saltans]